MQLHHDYEIINNRVWLLVSTDGRTDADEADWISDPNDPGWLIHPEDPDWLTVKISAVQYVGQIPHIIVCLPPKKDTPNRIQGRVVCLQIDLFSAVNRRVECMNISPRRTNNPVYPSELSPNLVRIKPDRKRSTPWTTFEKINKQNCPFISQISVC